MSHRWLRAAWLSLAVVPTGCGEADPEAARTATGGTEERGLRAGIEEAAAPVPAGPMLDIKLPGAASVVLGGEGLVVRRARESSRVSIAEGDGSSSTLRLSARDDEVVMSPDHGLEAVEPGPVEIECAPAGSASPGAIAITWASGSSGRAERSASYRGMLRVSASRGALQITNRLSLEEYLSSVVGSEMPASVAPIETLKAQAIAARGFALHAIQSRENRSLPVEFMPDESFQAYGGVEKEHPKVLRAVRETAGEVLTYRGRLFRTYFHATCGGRTSSGAEIFGEPPIEPLRGVECADCGKARHAQWISAWSGTELAQALRPLESKIGGAAQGIESIEIVEREPGGRVKYVRIRHAGGSFELLGSRLRVLLGARGENPMRSTAFTVRKVESGFVFEGKGWGHGVGLCQSGAMVKGETMDFRGVLEGYFPLARIEKVY